MRACGRIVLALVLVVVVGMPVPGQQDWEPISSDYRNVRGINFLATYPDLNGSPNYCGIASNTAMWRHYTTHDTGTWRDVDAQLGWLKKAGINSIRVFLSFVMWDYYEDNPHKNEVAGKNEFIRRFEHFIGLCDQHRIYVVPVTWDSFGGDPDYNDPLGLIPFPPVPINVCFWHATPGCPRLYSLVAEDPTLVSTRAGLFLRQCVAAFAPYAGHPGPFLMWDVFNEPHFEGAFNSGECTPWIAGTHLTFLQSSLAIIKAAAAETPDLGITTFGGLVTNSNDAHETVTVALDPNLDVISLHIYSHTRVMLESFLYDATNVVDPATGLVTPAKPVLCNEIGGPGDAWAYQDALGYATGVPRPDLGPGEVGIGYMPWVHSIDWELSTRPFNNSNGLFYGNGQVREADAVMAFVNVAIAQGIDPMTLFTATDLAGLQIQPSDPGYLEQGPVPIHADDYAYLKSTLLTPIYAGWTYSKYEEVSKVFSRVSAGLEGPFYWASTNNGNPFHSPNPPPGWIVSPSDSFAQNFYLSHVPPNSPNHADLICFFEGYLGIPKGSFDPQNDQTHMDLLNQALSEWRLVMFTYVCDRGGPYP